MRDIFDPDTPGGLPFCIACRAASRSATTDDDMVNIGQLLENQYLVFMEDPPCVPACLFVCLFFFFSFFLLFSFFFLLSCFLTAKDGERDWRRSRKQFMTPALYSSVYDPFLSSPTAEGSARENAALLRRGLSFMYEVDA